MLEFMALAGLVSVGLLGVFVFGLVVTVVKLVLWLVLLPLRLVFKLMWVPVFALGAAAAAVVCAGLVLIPLAPLILVAALVWMVVKRSSRPVSV